MVQLVLRINFASPLWHTQVTVYYYRSHQQQKRQKNKPPANEIIGISIWMNQEQEVRSALFQMHCIMSSRSATQCSNFAFFTSVWGPMAVTIGPSAPAMPFPAPAIRNIWTNYSRHSGSLSGFSGVPCRNSIFLLILVQWINFAKLQQRQRQIWNDFLSASLIIQ
jgi:hypothetical protein